MVTKAGGTSTTISPTEVACVPSEYDPDVQIVEVRERTKDRRFLVEVVPFDVAGGKTFSMPVDAGSDESGPANASVFFGAPGGTEASSTEEESTGTLRVVRASCAPARPEMEIDATLGSEYFDGDSVTIKGRLDLG